MNLGNLLTQDGPGFTLPIDVLVSNSSGLLGSDCTIGDAASPITVNLTTGTTNPPAPNTPISGSVGTVTSNNKGIVSIKGISLVDNAFAVPGAENCGSGGILDEILDLDKSLPSAAGNNSAVLSGNSFTAPAALIRQVPRLGNLHPLRVRRDRCPIGDPSRVACWRLPDRAG